MSLIVEDGTGKTDAESYSSVAQFRARAAKLGIDLTNVTDPSIETWLRLGFENMGESYRLRWAGTRVTTTQAGDWPRYNVPMVDGPASGQTVTYYPSNIVPAEVVNANIDLAFKARSGQPLTPDLTQPVKRKRAGSVEIEYADFSRATKSYPAIDAKLLPFLAARGGVKMVRG